MWWLPNHPFTFTLPTGSQLTLPVKLLIELFKLQYLLFLALAVIGLRGFLVVDDVIDLERISWADLDSECIDDLIVDPGVSESLAVVKVDEID